MHWWLEPRNKPALLWAVLEAFPQGAYLSLEGDLKNFGLLERADASSEETSSLRRNTLSPRLDFVVVPVTTALVATLKELLSGPGIFGDDGSLIHAQIEHNGRLVFGAYDNFHKDCVVAYEPLDQQFLERLCNNGVLRGYAVAA